MLGKGLAAVALATFRVGDGEESGSSSESVPSVSEASDRHPEPHPERREGQGELRRSTFSLRLPNM